MLNWPCHARLQVKQTTLHIGPVISIECYVVFTTTVHLLEYCSRLLPYSKIVEIVGQIVEAHNVKIFESFGGNVNILIKLCIDIKNKMPFVIYSLL